MKRKPTLYPLLICLIALSLQAKDAEKVTPKKESNQVALPTTGYRNLALNPEGKRGEFPKTSSNSVCRNELPFSHVNVINGRTDNKGHGGAYPSWGPDKRDDLWLKIDLGKEFDLNKAVITIRADFNKADPSNDHDSWWKSGVLEFSDGSKLPFTLKKEDGGQTIAFPKRKASWMKITNLVPDSDKWCGFTEVEIWGQ